MAKDIGLSCPLCLNVYDPEDMLDVEIPHARFPLPEPAKFCRPCVIVFMKSAVASELIDPREVFGDVPINADQPASGDPSESVSAVHDPGVHAPQGSQVGKLEAAHVHNEDEVSTPGTAEPDKR